MSKETKFSLVYNSFLNKITEDMYLELNEIDTAKMLEKLLINAIPKFEFPRVDLLNYKISECIEESYYTGNESGGQTVPAFIYSEGCFCNNLTFEEIDILATYMVVEWLNQQLVNVDLVRMKYSGSDFKLTSQANHMSKLIQLRENFKKEAFHLQRLYKRRKRDKNGKIVSTFGEIMFPKGGAYDN